MKKFAIVLFMSAFCIVAFGQKNVRQSASNYLKDGKLDKAVEAINQCVQDASTAQDDLLDIVAADSGPGAVLEYFPTRPGHVDAVAVGAVLKVDDGEYAALYRCRRQQHQQQQQRRQRQEIPGPEENQEQRQGKGV